MLLGRIQPDFFPSLFGPEGDRAARRRHRAPSPSSRTLRAVRCPARRTPRHSPPAASASRSRTWRTPSRRSPCSAATTSPNTRSPASAAPRASTPAWSPTRSACAACSFIRWPACCRPMASGSPTRMVMRQRTAEVPLDADVARTAGRAVFARSNRRRARSCGRRVSTPARSNSSARVLLKYADTDSTLTLTLQPDSTPESLTAEFLAQYRTRFGFHVPGRAIVIDTIGVTATGRSRRYRGRVARPSRRAPARCSPSPRARCSSMARWLDTPFFERESLRPGDAIAGPAVICERNTTVVVERGWRATLTDADNLVLDKTGAARRANAVDARRSGAARDLQQPVHGHRRADGRDARQHGELREHQGAPRFLLRAVRRATGQLIANAPHMPVHLGSMGESVQEILRRRGRDMQPGDAFALNAPYAGGTHLPDVTVVMPVFLGAAQARSSSSRRAAITPTSAASRRARCRLTRRPSTRKACSSTACASSIAACSSRTKLRALLTSRRAIPCATSRRISPTCARRSPPARKASRS